MGENVLLQIHAGSDLDQLKPFFVQTEDAALGDVEGRLLAPYRVAAAVGTVLDLLHELVGDPFLENLQLPVLDLNLELPGAESADENDLLGVLADVDESARARDLRPEFADVQVAFPVGLGKAKEGDIKSAAIVKIELVGLVDQRLRIRGSAEIQAAGGDAPNDSWLRRKGHQVYDPFLVGDVGDALGHADAQVDDAVWLQFHGGAPGDNLALAHLHQRNRTRRQADLRAESGVVLLAEGLPVVLGLRNDDAIHEDAWNLDVAWIERAAFGDPLNLSDHDTTGVPHCACN